MVFKQTQHTEASEPMYDDNSIALVQEQETEELIRKLAEYARSLELQVVQLRRQVNHLTPVDQAEPFPELYSDFLESFDQLAAYSQYKHLLTPLE